MGGGGRGGGGGGGAGGVEEEVTRTECLVSWMWVKKKKHSFCPTHTLERTRMWPSGADFRDKLWRSKEELQITAQFFKNIYLQI